MDLLSLPSLANLCVNNRHKGNQISIRNRFSVIKQNKPVVH